MASTLASSSSIDAATLLPIARDARGNILPYGDDVVLPVVTGADETVTLCPVRELFRGSSTAPDLSKGPSRELMPFVFVLEATVVRFCDADGRDATDQDMERIYSELRRRPDGRPHGVDVRLYSHVRAAARLYMSARDVSQAEYDAVMARLAKSARTFSMAPISRNYLATLRETI